MEDIKDKCAEHSPSPCYSGMRNAFGDPQVFPRVGDEYQAEIPPLIVEYGRSQLINIPRNSEFMANIHKHSPLGLPIPVTWSSSDAENINGTVEFENEEGIQIISKDECTELLVEPADVLSVNSKGFLVHSELQKAGKGNEMEVDLVLPPESETKMNQVERSFSATSVSAGKCWMDIEHDSFLLGLYIFGKNLVLVKRFVATKGMGDILSFYYGKFYMSENYCRWSECRKLKSRRSICGQKIFSGWRQQELLLRLSSHVSQECQNMLGMVSRSLEEGKISLEEYAFTLKEAVGIKVLVEAIGIGKGKQDLTGIAMEHAKLNHAISVRPEIPVGKACSSLTSAEIIKLLTGNFRLSKARSSDLFWEAVWPRLLARGWHSEQPKDQSISGSNRSLVFLIPGIKKFSRRKLVKGNHYFDSVSDVLNKVALEPRLLELEVEPSKDNQTKDESGLEPPPIQDQDGLSNNRRHYYLQQRGSNHNRKVQKFTVVDTSLACGAERPKVRELRSLPIDCTRPKARELRSLPVNCTSVSTSSGLSSETEHDSSEGSQENAEEVKTSNPAEHATDGGTFANSSDYENSIVNTCLPNALGLTIAPAAIENHKNQSTSLDNDFQQRTTMEYQLSHKAKCAPVTARDHGELSCITKDGKLNEDESHCTSNSPHACKDMVFRVDVLRNLTSASSLAEGSPDASNEGIVCENYPGTEVSLEKPQSSKLIDLNIPQVFQDFGAEESIRADTAQTNDNLRLKESSFLPETNQQYLNIPQVFQDFGAEESIGADTALTKDNLCVKESSFLPETNQQPEPLKLPDAGAPVAQEHIITSLRKSTRNRPLTIKALEALELGFLNTKKKRKGGNALESPSMSRCYRHVRGRTDVKSTDYDARNDVADSKSEEVLAGIHNYTESQA